MKKGWIIGGVVLLLVFIIYRLFAGSYNNLVEKEEGVTKQWAQVENSYQRRADLIPNLVNTVKGYAEFEKSTLEAVVNARAKATGITVDPTNLTPDKIQQFQQAQDQLSGALSRLLVTIEKYPDLKANQNFLELQAQLEGTENRIAVERGRFNEMVEVFNVYLRKFPTNIIAGMFGFQKKGYFEATAGAEKAPEVKF
jgi:LemA protein